MKKFLFLIFIQFAVIATGIELEEEDINVYKVTDQNFEEILKKFPNLFVKFQSPWCGHCKTLTPEFNKAAQELQLKGVNVAFGNIDATVEQQLAAKFDIRAYPTIKMFIDGIPIEYENWRKSEQIIDWIMKKISKGSELISSKEELYEKIEKTNILAVYFGENNEELEIFQRISKQFEDIEFVHSFQQEIKEHFQGGQIVLFKQFDEKRNDYREKFDTAKIYEFIATNSVPTILEFEQKAVYLIFSEFQPAMVMFVDPQQNQEEYKQFELASKYLKDKLLLIKCFIDEGYGYRLAEFMGVTAQQLPVFYIMKVEGQQDLKKYRFADEITADNLIQFYNDYTRGQLSAVLNSEEIPESNDGPLIKVVSKQFHQIVMDQTKDVLVKYYAPWCEQSKALAPIYAEVAESLKVNPNIIIAEYDATLNENEEVQIQGFPTLIFYPANKKQEPIKYEGIKIEEDIIAFIKEFASVQWIEPVKKRKQQEEQKIEEQKSEL